MLNTIKKQAEQIDKLVDTNSKLIDAISKRGFNRLSPNKSNNNKGEELETPSKKNDMCGIFGKHHDTKKCYNLEQNKDKRQPHWKRMLEQDTTGSNNNNKEMWKPGRVILNRTKRDRNDKFNPLDLNYWTLLTDQVEESD